MNARILAVISVVVFLVAGVFYIKSKSTLNTQTIEISKTSPSPVAISASTPEIIFSPSPTFTPVQTVNVNDGEARGQIVCDYKIPAAPNMQGDADISSNWNNTIVSVCVNVNGNNTLMASDNEINGKRTDNVNWISLNTNYEFDLHNAPNCGGQVISSCYINQTSPTSSSSGFKH